jgi:hypothetical protein
MSTDSLIEENDAPTIPLVPVGPDSLEIVTKDLAPGTDDWVKGKG